jgi:hypothetical protein
VTLTVINHKISNFQQQRTHGCGMGERSSVTVLGKASEGGYLDEREVGILLDAVATRKLLTPIYNENLANKAVERITRRTLFLTGASQSRCCMSIFDGRGRIRQLASGETAGLK